ncbi:MAG: pyridoxamine 5'-phosphate oxidase family protein [Lentimicrobiaceae bacterium]|jgi:nitroimidazol reductase NimA-like FMN-containing flavoprotein (pyridoxamine 5'-phosphate oxidase superfamily)|nr:pyridoxamine 5'-phosphate oxidase family protein [Lentimicrobiaceae bacterium]
MNSKKLAELSEIESIIHKSTYCTVGMIDENGLPYVLPMNFGYADQTLYLHCGSKGKKINAFRKNKQVCVNFCTNTELHYRDVEIACSYSMKYRSAVLYGSVEFIEDLEEKERCLRIIMQQYTIESVRFSVPALKNVCVIKVPAERLEGRALGY